MPQPPKSPPVPASEPAFEERVRLRHGWGARFIPGAGIVQPGAFVSVIPVDEARRRPEFEVVRVPLAPETPETPETPAETPVAMPGEDPAEETD